jgi:hypothetical protein
MSAQQSSPEFLWRRPQTFLAVAMAAATTPRLFFAQLPRQGGFLPPLAFFVAAMLLPTLVRTGGKWQEGPGAMLTFLATSLLISLVLALVFAFVLYCVCRFVFKSSLELPLAVRIVCYSSGVRVLEFVPPLLSPLAATLLLLFMVLSIGYLVWMGVQAAGGLNRYQALAALLLSFLAMVGLWLLINFLRGAGSLPVHPPAGGPAAAPAPGQP